ncbi:DUF3110 domain-containing protein [Oscillatoria sp. FACHB-1406]|uniref:DUF3110 domain-containing protein n=1 Tax=Oscillatoria sp. FACHB-1406 TaxID=2692846 RepID=UPI001687A056|nr:DUF3110 domain-containing protein [Oscillatoria sp. FACHB-1406]
MLAPKRIFVLLINAGTENEGIHTLQMGGRNKVLMFESEDDALRYALMLEAQDFPAPTVEAFPSDDIEEFCREAGYDSEFVETGRLEIPPELNVEKPDWEENNSKTPEPEAAEESEMSDSELEAIRRRLEGLL